MGFNINMFFKELNDILTTGSVFTRYSRLKRAIKAGERYARECNLVR